MARIRLILAFIIAMEFLFPSQGDCQTSDRRNGSYVPTGAQLMVAVKKLISKGDSYLEEGECDKAISEYSLALKIDSNNRQAYTSRGVAYSTLKQFRLALEDFNKAIEIAPGDPDTYIDRGESFYRQGNYEKAIADYERCLELSKTIESKRGFESSVKAYNNLGNAVARLGLTERAISYYDKAIALDPGYALAYVNRAYANKVLGHYDKVIEDCNSALKLDPDRPKAYIYRSEALSRMGRLSESIADLEKLRAGYGDEFNDAPFYLQARALLRFKNGNRNQAIADIEKAIRNSIIKEEKNQAVAVQKEFTEGAAGLVRDKWALIVGVSQFKDGRVPKLRYSAKDARDFRDYLVKEAGFAPDHVRLLVNEQATEKRVMSELGDKFIARVAKPDDLVVLYFSTHGSPASADLRQRNYVLAYDTEVDNLFATGIEMQKILDIIKDRANSGRVLLVLDACHSGAAGPGAKAFGSSGNFDAEALAQGSGQLVICSSQPNERSWESSRYDNGIFTRKLLDGLRINGKSTKLGDAFEYVKKSVAAEAREAHGASQSPVLRSKWDGNDLMIACPAGSPSAVPPEVKAGLQPDSSQVAVPARLFSPDSPPSSTKAGTMRQGGKKKNAHVGAR